jgi:uncharacterized protein YrrD
MKLFTKNNIKIGSSLDLILNNTSNFLLYFQVLKDVLFYSIAYILYVRAISGVFLL